MGGISDDRRRRAVRASGFILAFLCCFSIVCFTQEGPPAAPSAPAQQSGVTPHDNHHLTLDVVVTDHAGKPVPGLQQQDFTLLDNRSRRRFILSASPKTPGAPDTSTDALILVDAVNTSLQGAAYQREELTKFLRRMAASFLCQFRSFSLPTDPGSRPMRPRMEMPWRPF